MSNLGGILVITIDLSRTDGLDLFKRWVRLFKYCRIMISFILTNTLIRLTWTYYA